MYRWQARKLKPSWYRMGYALSPTEGVAVRKAHQTYAKKVRYRPIDRERFKWVPPPGCGQDMRCVFNNLVARNTPDIRPVANLFKSHALKNRLNTTQAASLVVTFIQEVRYEIPHEEPFGVLPPALVVSEKRGDCDSKAILAFMLLRELGIDSVLISSDSHQHTMLGVALPTSGKHFTYRGRRYAFVETTAKGSPIGHINPELMRPNDWRAVPLSGKKS